MGTTGVAVWLGFLIVMVLVAVIHWVDVEMAPIRGARIKTAPARLRSCILRALGF